MWHDEDDKITEYDKQIINTRQPALIHLSSALSWSEANSDIRSQQTSKCCFTMFCPFKGISAGMCCSVIDISAMVTCFDWLTGVISLNYHATRFLTFDRVLTAPSAHWRHWCYLKHSLVSETVHVIKGIHLQKIKFPFTPHYCVRGGSGRIF